MTDLLATTLNHLRALVAFDTRNPPRAIGTGGIFDYLRAQSAGLRLRADRPRRGCGEPVCRARQAEGPVQRASRHRAGFAALERDPFELRVTGERAIGLGACDIKGAAAALLAAAAQTQRRRSRCCSPPTRKRTIARCIAAFLAQKQAVRRRRSSPSRRAAKRCSRIAASVGAHALSPAVPGTPRASNAASDSALHQAMRWGARALDYRRRRRRTQRFGGLTGLRFNIGRIEGGIKANVIAPSAEVRFGFRPLPSMDTDALLATFRGCADTAAGGIRGNLPRPVVARGDIAQAEARRLAARDLADALGHADRQRGGFLDRSLAVLAGRLHRIRLRPRRHRAGAQRPMSVWNLSQLQQCRNATSRIVEAVDVEHGHAQTDPPDHRAPAFEHGQREGNSAVPASASRSSTPSASPWSRSAARCCATIWTISPRRSRSCSRSA